MPATVRLAILAVFLGLPLVGGAAILVPPSVDDRFGVSVSLSGGIGLVGAEGEDFGGGISDDIGAAYVYRGLDTATGSVTHSAQLTASNGKDGDLFGAAVDILGNRGLVLSWRGNGNVTNSGAVYLYNNLDTVSGTVTEDARLVVSTGAAGDLVFGSVNQSGNSALVGGTRFFTGGVAYLFRNLDTATGTINESVTLTSTDGASFDFFGGSVSLSGSVGLVGASGGSPTSVGAAYLYRNLDTASGTITQDVKLVASDLTANNGLGSAVSLEGNTAVVGAVRANGAGPDDNGVGAAYLYRNLDTATDPIITEQAKLVASEDPTGGFERVGLFGLSVSHSGNTALIGAPKTDRGGFADFGAAFLYLNLDTASGVTRESVKLFASDGQDREDFGRSVSLDGDLYVIGAFRTGRSQSGKAYSGRVSTVTTLDEGNVSRTTDGISFESRTDWIIGETTDNNVLTLAANDSADVTHIGQATYIGKDAGSDNNRLVINGTLISSSIQVGAVGNTGNALEINQGGSVTTTGGGLAVSGTGSLTVGKSGTGTLNVKAGGGVSNGVGIVGDEIGSMGVVTVTGTDGMGNASHWENTSSLIIGNQGTGTLTVAGDGQVSVNSGAGTLVLANTGSGKGTLNIGTDPTLADPLQGAGIVNTVEVTTALGTGTINFNHNSNNYAFTSDGTMGGTAVSITGSTSVNHLNGTTTLNAANTYTGGTTIAGGTLLANNTTGSATGTGDVTVDAGATLGGDGTISGNVVVNGTLAPGNSPGTLNVGGDLSLAGLTVIEIDSLASFDQVDVIGQLSYGGELYFNFNFLPTLTDTFDIFDFSTQISNFDNITFNPGITGTFNNATGVLSLTAIPEPEVFGLLAALGALGLAMRRRSR